MSERTVEIQAQLAQEKASQQFNARMEASRPATRGPATRFTNQYNISQYSYPIDLMNPEKPYAGNYVVFYINVHEDSSLIRENKVAVVEGNIPTRTKGFISGQQMDDEAVEKTFTASNMIGGAAAGAVMNAAGLGSSSITNLPGAGLAIGGMASLATISTVGKIKAEYKRIQQAIALYMPMDMNISYGVNWMDENMAGVGALFGMGENVLKAITDSSKGIEGRIDEILNAFGTAKSFTAGAVLDATPVGQAISKTSGVAANPKKEQIFKSVNHREFTFTYQFFSRSPEEAQAVHNIIKLFKMHMHPEYKINTGNFLYVYPSEWDIYYYNNGVENMNVHRHTSCVLTNMNVRYTPLGQYVSFADGAPTQVDVTLNFRELALLSKELIEDGF